MIVRAFRAFYGGTMSLSTSPSFRPLALAAAFASFLAVAGIGTGCEKESSTPTPASQHAAPTAAATTPAAAPAPDGAPKFDEEMLIFFKPLPSRMDTDANPATPEKIALGRMLYYDTRLSKNHDLSCNSCHPLDRYGVDGEKTSPGHKGQRGARNSPTVYNAGLYLAQFWDGRAPDLEEQAKGPILNPVEMAMPSEAHVVRVLESIPGYVEAFRKAFPGEKKPITYHNMAKAIAAFERGLVTPSRFDKFLAGDRSALTPEELEGLAQFATLGCPTCHNGPSVGGTSFQRIGLVVPYDDLTDLGRYEVTKQPGDKNVFKVPSLRNVTRTAPYFHNGRFDALEDVVRAMARHQLGKQLTDVEVKRVITFLKTLEGDLPAEYIRKPELPPSGPKTPPPDPS